MPGDKLRLDVYTFKVIGPSPSEAKTQLRAPARRGDLKPTSPGNRIDPVEPAQSRWPLLASLGFLAMFLALAVYLFL